MALRLFFLRQSVRTTDGREAGGRIGVKQLSYATVRPGFAFTRVALVDVADSSLSLAWCYLPNQALNRILKSSMLSLQNRESIFQAVFMFAGAVGIRAASSGAILAMASFTVGPY